MLGNGAVVFAPARLGSNINMDDNKRKAGEEALVSIAAHLVFERVLGGTLSQLIDVKRTKLLEQVTAQPAGAH